MFSKLSCLLLSACVLMGCAREKDPAYKPVIATVDGSGDCLSAIAVTATDYIHERLARPQLEQFWNCTIKAVSDYQRLTTGDGPDGRYSPQAVRYFLQRYFIKDRPLSDGLLMSLMQVKRVLVAGSDQNISDMDLVRLQQLLGVFRDMTLDLQPYVGLLFMQHKSASDEEILEANRHLQSALIRLSDWLDSNQQGYTFAQLQGLINGLQGWSGHSIENDDFYADINKVLQLLPNAKRVLVAGDVQGFSARDWRPVITSLTRGYGLFLGVHYAFAETLNAGLVRNAVPNTASDLALMLHDAVAARPTGNIPMDEWDDLFIKLEATDWLPEGFTAAAMNRAWIWFLTRPLGGLDAKGLTQAHVQRLQAQVDVWKNLSAYARGGAAAPTPEIQLFMQVRDASIPMQWDDQHRLMYPNPPPAGWTQAAQIEMVWPFVIINWLKTSYFGDATTLTQDQLTTVAAEVLPVLQGFGWLQSTQTTIAARLINEADLFTSASDGDGKLSLSEAVRYASFVASALRTAQLWSTAAIDTGCPATKGVAEAECLRETALQPGQEAILAAYPRLVAAQKGKSISAFSQYLKRAEVTALGNEVKGPYALGDLVETAVLMQYIETFFQRYDSDNSDLINVSEAQNAFVLYRSAMQRIFESKGLPTDQLYEFFTFMMKYGSLPFDMFGGEIKWQNWLLTEGQWDLAADRSRLLDILFNLATLGNNSTNSVMTSEPRAPN